MNHKTKLIKYGRNNTFNKFMHKALNRRFYTHVKNQVNRRVVSSINNTRVTRQIYDACMDDYYAWS